MDCITLTPAAPAEPLECPYARMTRTFRTWEINAADLDHTGRILPRLLFMHDGSGESDPIMFKLTDVKPDLAIYRGSPDDEHVLRVIREPLPVRHV